MSDALGRRADFRFWAQRAATSLPGPLKAAVDAWALTPNRGRFDTLIRQAEASLLRDGDELIPDRLTGPTRDILWGVLEQLAADLTASHQADVRAEALAGGAAWQHRFTAAFGLRDPVVTQDDELRGYFAAIARSLALAVRDWIIRNDVKTLADGMGRMLREYEALHKVAAEDSGSARRKLARLKGDSRRFLDSIGQQFTAAGSASVDVSDSPPEPYPLFIAREVQGRVVERILSGDTSTLVVVGEAGYGKTSLLWGVARALTASSTHEAIAVSAVWFAGVAGEADARTNCTDIVQALIAVDVGERTPVVLLDTADLLLHSSASVLATLELVDELAELRVPLVLTVRPAESDKFGSRIERKTLRHYSPDEMSSAVRTLSRKYLPGRSPDDIVDLVVRAQVRGLPVLEVLQSPLLLTILFELSNGVAPSMDMDVTELYRRYWQERIESDRRDRDERPVAGEDLSGIACRIALGMLAEGSPDVETESLLDAAIQIEFPIDVPQPSVAAKRLVRRGVLVAAGGRTRFFHQTLFEFAAAKALARRPDPVGEADRLLDHVLAEPLDLFVGAVLEQLLVLLSGVASRREAIASLVSRLLDSQVPTVIQIGVAVCARQSAFEPQLTAQLDRLPAVALRRYLTLAPQTRNLDATVVIEQMWNVRRSELLHDIVRAIGRIARRDPTRVAALVRRIDLIGHVTRQQPEVLSNAEEVFSAVFALATADRQLVREFFFVAADAVPGPDPLVLLARHVVEQWEAIGDGDYLVAVFGTIDAVLAGRDRVPGRDVRNALGALLVAERRRVGFGTAAERVARARRVLMAIDERQTTFAIGAELVALTRELQELTSDDDLTPYLDEVFRIPAKSGPPQVAGLLLAPLLVSDVPIREPLIMRLRAVLCEGLPSRDNAPGLTGVQRWAIAVRRTLIDERVSPRVAARCLSDVPGADELPFWCDAAYGLGVLAVAATGGHAGARTAVRYLAEHSDALEPHAQRVFLDTARAYVAADEMLGQAAVAVAIACDALGTLQELAQSPWCGEALRESAADVNACLTMHFGGDDGMQKRAITLWESLQRQSISSPTVEELVATVSDVRVRQQKARLIRMMIPVVRADAAQVGMAARWLNRHEPDAADIEAEACRAVRRAILGAHGGNQDWPTLVSLLFDAPAAPENSVGPVMMRDASTFIRRTFARGDESSSVVQLFEVSSRAMACAQSRKQRRNLTAVFHGIAVEMVLRGSTECVARLVGGLGNLTPNLAQAIVSASLVVPASRAVLEGALDRGALTGDIAQFAAEKLNALPREVGRGALPAIFANA